MKSEYIVLDCETYCDYFLLAMMQTGTGKIQHYEMYDGCAFDASAVAAIMQRRLTVGFNSLNYDLPMIVAALQGFDNQALKKLSDRIITGSDPAWKVCRENNIAIPPEWDHIDLIDVAPGTASLKIYGGRLHAPRLQDLPIAPDASISPDMRDALRKYCINDLETTAILLDALAKPIALRCDMSAKYGMDLRSKSDAQIAETVIVSELSKRTRRRFAKAEIDKNKTYRYQDPGIINFEIPDVDAVFKCILKERFELDGNGSIKLPEWLKRNHIKIGSGVYRLGVGGLHSSEKSQYVEAGDGLLFELDVASYYPNIILQQNLAPESMGREFLEIYGEIVADRIKAKNEGDKTTSDALKIAANGSFGKLGSKYSALYSPDLLMQTTITGQLALLMLIERIENAGAKVVSANTDGVVVWCEKAKERAVNVAAWGWELDTSYTLERTDYKCIASRDVNNYIAIGVSGQIKGKGCFASAGLMKNPNRNIVTKAVAERIANGIDVDQTIKSCDDVRQFLTVRTVKGGAIWQGESLGRAIRYYSSRTTPPAMSIHYQSNGNRVPNSAGCRPLMDLPETLPGDVDYDAYIRDAEAALRDVGFLKDGDLFGGGYA